MSWAPQSPPQGPHQPRWAWWVVGIVIPLAGILITVLMSRPGSSDDTSVESAPTPTQASDSAESGGQEQPAASPTKSTAVDPVRYGPQQMEVDTSDGGAAYIELDGSAPVVSRADSEGADLIYQTTGSAPTLYVPDSAGSLALLADSGSAPTASECAGTVESNGVYTETAKRGSRFCLLTKDGNVAYLRVVSVPQGRGVGKLDVTVWGTPDA